MSQKYYSQKTASLKATTIDSRQIDASQIFISPQKGGSKTERKDILDIIQDSSINVEDGRSLPYSNQYIYSGFHRDSDIKELEKEIRAQVKKATDNGFKPSHLDNHMGSLYGIESGRFELLNLTLDIAGEEKLPFRFPGTFVPEMFDNDTLEVKIDKDLIAMFFGKIVEHANSLKVAMPDFLIPGEWNGPQDESYENFKEYIYELYRSFPNGITETYIHPAFESDELKGISGAWHRRVWEHKLFSDPQTLQHIKACGIQLINYRDLAEMKK
jgi:predicted glycoside hydrolase/deacetylase ChbG (UPF0249 family)